MSTAAELKLLRRQTLVFIEDNPIDVTLMRSDLVPDGAGGRRIVRAPLAPQRFRKITQATGTGVARTSVDGTELVADYVLLGRFDADILAGDEFNQEGRVYRVLYVRDDRRYETWAEVASRG